MDNILYKYIYVLILLLLIINQVPVIPSITSAYDQTSSQTIDSNIKDHVLSNDEDSTTTKALNTSNSITQDYDAIDEEIITSNTTEFGVLNVKINASSLYRTFVYVEVFKQYAEDYWHYVTSNYTDDNGKVSFTLPPGIYYLELWGPLNGRVHNVTIEPGKNTNVTITPGFLSLKGVDAQGNDLDDINIYIYEEIIARNSTYVDEEDMIGFDRIDDGLALIALIPGTYAMRLSYEYTDIDEWLYDIVIEPGKTVNYTVKMNIVPVNFTFKLPENVDINWWDYADLKLYPSYTYNWIYLYGVPLTEARYYLRPGHYVLVLYGLWSKGSHIECNLTREFDVVVNGDNNVEITGLAKLVFNLTDSPETNTYDIYVRIKTVKWYMGNILYSDYIGHTYVPYSGYIWLPPGQYCLEFYAFHSLRYLIDIEYVNITSTTTYVLTTSLNLSYLNISIVFQDELVTGYIDLYRYENNRYTYVTYAYTDKLIPVIPGKYKVVVKYMGYYNNTIEDIEVKANEIVNVTIPVGKLVIHVYNGEGPADHVPIYIFPIVNGEIYVDHTLYTHGYTVDGVLTRYLLPGEYAIVIPGTNTTKYYRTYARVGYGIAELNIWINGDQQVDKNYVLGTLKININKPSDMDIESPHRIGIATQTIINGTPAIGEEIDTYGLRSSLEITLTPGVYVVYLKLGDIILNDTIRYNIVIRENETFTISYTLNYVTFNVTTYCGLPASDIPLYLSAEIDGDEETMEWIGKTDENGLLTVALYKGIYELDWSYGWDLYKKTHIINVTENSYQMFNIRLEAGIVKIYALGPYNRPLANTMFGVYLYGIRLVDYIYTDEYGEATIVLPLDASYSVKPIILWENRPGLTFSLDEEDCYKQFYFNFSIVDVYINADFDDEVKVTFYDKYYYSYDYFYVFTNKHQQVYLLPGEYIIALSGINTTIHVWPYYGYGEEETIIIDETPRYYNITFNLTYIAFLLNTTKFSIPYIGVKLYSIDEQGNFDRYITYTSIWRKVPHYATFYVTPGRYGLYVDLDVGLTYTNITAEIGKDNIIVHSPCDFYIFVTADTDTQLKDPVQVDLYYWWGGSWHYTKTTNLFINESENYLLPSITTYKVVAYFANHMIYNKVVDLTGCSEKILTIKLYGITIKLTGPENDPVRNSYVKLYNRSDNSFVYGEYTDSKGQLFIALPPGDYKIVLPGLNYPPYTSKYDKVGCYGYGAEYNVSFTGGEILVYEITLARIDFKVVSPDGPAENVQASLYDPTHTTPLIGGLTGEDGRVSFYVTPGNYSVVIRGVNYGWNDYYSLGLDMYGAHGYGDYVNVNAPAIGVYSYEYRISKLVVHVLRVNGTGIEDVEVQLRIYGYYSPIHITHTDENGLATIYVTPGSYNVSVMGKLFNFTIGDYERYDLYVTLATLTIKLDTPLDGEIENDLLKNIGIQIYQGYSGSGTGTLVSTIYTNDKGIAYVNLFIGETYQIVLPGSNTTGAYNGLGYGDYISVYIDSDKTIVFNLSVVKVYVDSPKGSLNGIYINVRCANLTGSLYKYTDYNGYAYFLVTKGWYVVRADILGMPSRTIYVDEYVVAEVNITSSILYVKNNNPLPSYSSLRIEIYSLDTGEYGYEYVYDEKSIYVGPGKYEVNTTSRNGYIYSRRVEIGFNTTGTVEFETRNLYIYVKYADGELASDTYFSVTVYTQKGVGENATIDYYVKSSGGYGEIKFYSLTPGLYAVKIGNWILGYRYVYDIEVSLDDIYAEKEVVLGELVVKLIYVNGTPIEGYLITVYTSTEQGGRYTYIASQYTDDEGKVNFPLFEGWYAIYVTDLGYFYGIYVESGEYTILTYTDQPSDISIENISWTPTVLIENLTTIFKVNITNYGPAPAYNNFTVRFYVNDTLVYTTKVKGLGAGDSTVVEAPIKMSKGNVTLKVVVDELGILYDDNRANNVKTQDLMVAEKTDIITLEKPVNNEYVSGYFKINGTITSTKPVNITVYLNGTLYTEINNLIGTYSLDVNASNYNDGPLYIVVIGVTTDGLEADYEEITVYLDVTPPYAMFIEPYNNSYVSGVVDVYVKAGDTYYKLPRPPVLYVNGTAYEMGVTWISNYHYALNTTIYPDGTILNLTVKVVDRVGHETIVTIYVIVDNTPPSTTHNATKIWYNTNVTIVLTATDNLSGVNTTYYRIDNGTWVEDTIVYIPAPLDHSNDGLHTIDFYSVDNAGNLEEIKSIVIGIDTVEPLITCTLKNNTYFAGGTVDIYYHLYDKDSGLNYYRLYMDGSLYMKDSLGGRHNYTISLLGLLLSYLSEGRHTIEVVVWDEAGNVKHYLTVYYVDKTPPKAKILLPKNGALVSGVINVTFNYTDNLSPVEAILKIGSQTINVTGTYSYLLDTTQYPDGSLTITLTVTDKSGRSTSTSITVYVDNTPPTINVHSPSNNTYVSGQLLVSYEIIDDHLYGAWLYFDGLIVNITGTSSYTIDTTTLDDGTYKLTIYANDTLGHSSQVTLVIIVDNTPPTAMITYPVNNAYVSGKLNIVFEYSDDNLDKAILYVDDGYIDVTGLYNYTIDTTYLTDGTHQLTLHVTDKAGNTAEYTIFIIVDNTAPYAKINSPLNNTCVTGTITVKLEYSDDNLDHAYLYVDNTLYGEITGENTVELDTTTYTDGLHVLKLLVVDKAGNEATYTVYVIIDNMPPTVDILTPQNNTIYHVGDTIVISVKFIDPNLADGTLYINDTQVPLSEDNTYTWNTSGWEPGLYVIKAIAIDMVNHTSKTIVYVTLLPLETTTPPINTTTPPAATTLPTTSPPTQTTTLTSPKPTQTPTKTTPTTTQPGIDIGTISIATVVIIIVIVAAIYFLRKK